MDSEDKAKRGASIALEFVSLEEFNLGKFSPHTTGAPVQEPASLRPLQDA